MLFIPAILEKSFSEAERKIKKLSAWFKRFQIDIADGKAVPNKTLEIIDFETKKFPHLSFDFHLMVENPEKDLEILSQKENVNLVFVNLKGASEKFFKTSYPFELGITLNPEDKPEEFARKDFFKKVKHVLVMTVNPGFQGSVFLPEMLEKLSSLKNLGFEGKIYLDGGINEKTIEYIKPYKNLVYALCIGSYFTKAQDPKKAKEILRENLED